MSVKKQLSECQRGEKYSTVLCGVLRIKYYISKVINQQKFKILDLIMADC